MGEKLGVRKLIERAWIMDKEEGSEGKGNEKSWRNASNYCTCTIL